MKRLLLLLCLIPCALAAQEGKDRTVLEMNGLGALWSTSSNAAGLVLSPYREFNTLDVRYSWQGGSYRPLQTGTRVSDIQFDTQGARQLGKVQVWGRFSYNNITDTGSSFNTLLFNPFDERFLYSAADTVEGIRKKQSYDMQFKAAMPLTENLSAGVHVRYTDRIAASQIDPRAESYHYSVVVRPSFALRLGKSGIGLSGVYSNTFERSTPTISNTQEVQKVFLMRGLGNWVGDQVGGSGLGTMYFRCNTWGGALQYAFDGDWKLFSDLSWARHSTVITERPTQPKPHGTTVQDEFSLSSGMRFGGGELMHRICADASLRITRGTEPTVSWNTADGSWQILSEIQQCTMLTADASLSYHLYKTDGTSYDWHLFAETGIEHKADSYLMPASSFAYDNIPARIGGEWRLHMGKGSLLLGAAAGGAKNLQAAYSYTGHRGDSAPVRVLYPHNLAIYSADRFSGSLSAEFAFPVSAGTYLAFCLEGAGTGALCGELGKLYRICADGAVKLYF